MAYEAQDETDWCASCGCDCFGNVFLCNRPSVGGCGVCGHQFNVPQEKFSKEESAAKGSTMSDPDDLWEGEEEMLPAPKQTAATSKKTSGAPRSGVPFLKVEDVTKEPKRAKILGVDTEAKGYNDVIIKINLEGRTFFHGLKLTNPNFEKLYNAFGENEKDWIKREYDVYLAYNDFYEKNMVDVEPIEGNQEAERATPRRGSK